MGKIKIGIIGCGWFGNFHYDNLMKIQDVEVVGIAGSNKSKLEEFGKKAKGVKLYNDYNLMIREEKELDAVIIAVPPDKHGDMEIIAANRGIHIYTEKPMALSLNKAKEIETVINKSGVISSVGFQERYNPLIENARKYISVREVGLASGRWIGGIPGADWWRRKERSGGQIVEQCIHIFDLLRNFFGEADTVYSTAMKGIVKSLPGYDIEDASTTIVTFKKGVIATILTACYIDDLKFYQGAGLQVICRDSIFEYDHGKEVRYITKDKIENLPVVESSHFNSVEAFIYAIKNNDKSIIRSPYSDAVKSLELTLAANESISTGKAINITP
jgi:myo-inositol 2-dehydrogenase / D-chiro-inositol 1-dehydrogenase